MRQRFVTEFLKEANKDSKLLLLTGDLGFMALEPAVEALKDRFINCGIAEQNMLTVAAGLAQRGFRPWVYSIAPFAIYRPYEQIRNNIGLHALPVKIIGNGGGFGYGIMGATHHALEDVGAMRVLPGMRVFTPAYDADLEFAVPAINDLPGPAYLRLNTGVSGTPIAPFAPWRKLTDGKKVVVLTMGTIVGKLLEQIEKFPEDTFEIHSVGVMPVSKLPTHVIESIERTQRLITLEEHVRAGGLGEGVAQDLLGSLKCSIRYLPLHAKGYPSGRYGSQTWHLEENELAGEPLVKKISDWLDLR